jgi:hypothetical protein
MREFDLSVGTWRERLNEKEKKNKGVVNCWGGKVSQRHRQLKRWGINGNIHALNERKLMGREFRFGLNVTGIR